MDVTNEKEKIKKFINIFELNGNECRLCLKKTNQVCKLFEINDELPRKIMACAHVQIDENDGLPTVICFPCRQLVDTSYNFKCQVEKSDEKLRNLCHLATSSIIDYDTAAIKVNNSMKQSGDQVINDNTIVNDIKIYKKGFTTDNLTNCNDLVELETSNSSLNNDETKNCVIMINTLKGNNHNNINQNTILFNVDIDHSNNKNDEQHHNINEIIQKVEENGINECDEMIVDIVTGKDNVLVEKLEQFHDIKQENCILIDKKSKLLDIDDDKVYHNGTIFIEQEGKIDVMKTMNEEIECYYDKIIEDKHVYGNDHNSDNDNKDNDNENDDDDDEDDDGDDDDDDDDEDGDDDDDENGNSNDDNDDNDDEDDDDDNGDVDGGDGDDTDDDNDDEENINDNKNDDNAKDEKQEVKVRKMRENNSDKNRIFNSTKLKYKCSHCVQLFTTKSALQRHEIIHNNNKTKFRYVCYMCDKQFATVNKLKNHVLRFHNSLKNDIKNNVVINDDNNEKINENINDIKSLTDEISVNNVNKKNMKFSCKYCSKQFTYEKPFLTHAKRHPEYKNNGNNKSMVINEKLELNNSVDDDGIHESEDDDMPLEGLQCRQCGKLFATKRNLTRHLSTHTGLKFNCTTCNKEFSRLDKLKEHEQIKHKNEFFGPSDGDDYDDSDSEFKSNITDNSKKEKNNRPHKCPLCPKAFAQLQSLTNHLERHQRVKDTQKRFLCEVCSKCFAQSGSLVAHMRTHTGVKPYVCNVCSRAFTKSTYLQLHLRTHSGEKPYICQYCSRAFARANTLARHITMHTGEAKYHCQICMKSFRRLTSLNEHTYTHTGQRPYACKICTKRYNNAGSLYAHTKKCKVQQLTNCTGNTTFNVGENNINNHNDMCTTPSTMLVYSPRKISNDVTNIDNDIGSQSMTVSSPSIIITNNVNNQKTSLTTNIIQHYTVDEPTNVYDINTKQYKNTYYTIYPEI